MVWGLTAVASAPAKIILFGEHFVVFGEPAIVLALDKRAYALAEMRKGKRVHIKSVNLELSGFFEKEKFKAEKGSRKKAQKELMSVRLAAQKILDQAKRDFVVSIEIRSNVPVAAGLGASAAVAAATAKAVSHLLDVSLSSEEIFNIACEAECIVHGTSSGIDPAIATYGDVLVFKRREVFTRLSVRKKHIAGYWQYRNSTFHWGLGCESATEQGKIPMYNRPNYQSRRRNSHESN